MQIYDLDFDTRLNELKDEITLVKLLKNNFSDDRESFRNFSSSINVDFRCIEQSIKSYEKSVLIDTYTLSEQLIKNIFYKVLFNNINNDELAYFLNEKLHPDRFSPNVKFEIIEKSFSKELFKDFSFILKKENEFIVSYDILIRERHSYAHTGKYNYEFDKIDDVIFALEYIYAEFKYLDRCKTELRNENVRNLRNLIKDFKKKGSIFKNYDPDSKSSLKACEEAIEDSIDIINKLLADFNFFFDLKIAEEVKIKMDKLLKCDYKNDLSTSIAKYNEILLNFETLNFKE